MNPSRTACSETEYAPVITDWDAITVAAVASTTIGSRDQCGNSRKNGLPIACGIAQDQRGLPEIVERQRRERDDEPGDADRRAPKCPMSA